MEERIKLGVSQCLLGDPVRYDGGHKLDRFIRDTLGTYVDLVPVCPETECGLGTPREPMQLEGEVRAPRLMTIGTRVDLTDRVLRWVHRRVYELEKDDLCGFILKNRSPSCGMARVKIHHEKGMPTLRGVGLFARAFKDHFPLLPAEDEDRLHDPVLRGNFIENIFALKRWRDTLGAEKTLGRLARFHAANTLFLLSHSRSHCQDMGKLIAQGGGTPSAELYNRYETLLLQAIRLKPTVKKHVNVLRRMMGYLKNLSSNENQELLEAISGYHQGLIPLIVPITLFNHYVRKFEEPFLAGQTYLNPHPAALKLLNHV